MKRRIVHVLAVLFAALLPAIIFAGPAQAQAKAFDPLCLINKAACLAKGITDKATEHECAGPPPTSPDLGPESWIARRPDPLPKAADPFADGATTSLYEQYGLSWARWRTCDLNAAWMPDIANTSATADTSIGSWILTVPVITTALFAGVIDVAMHPSSWLGWFRPALTGITDGIRDGLTEPAIQILLMLTTIALLWHARKGEISKAITALVMVAVVGGGVAVLTADPFRWVEDGSEVTAQVVGGVSVATSSDSTTGTSDDPAAQSVSRVVDVVIYRAWLQGMFGSSDSATAKTYGPELLKAGSLNWEESEAVRKGDDKIIEEKQERWKKLMAGLRTEDPQAYEYATGRGETRAWAAVRAVLAMLCILPILIVGALVILALPIYLLVAVVHLLLVLPLAMLPSQTATAHVRVPLLNALRAFINAVVMGVAMSAQLFVVSELFDPARNIPGWLAVIFCGACTVVAWKATKKHRTVVSTPAQKVWGGVKTAAGLGAAAYTGGAALVAAQAANRAVDNDEQKEENHVETDSAHAERAQPMLAIESGPLPHEKEEALLMESEVIAARHRLTQVPQQRQASYQPQGGGLLTSVPGQQHWTPEPAPGVRRAAESDPDVDGLPTTPAPTGWPRPGQVLPPPESEPTGWPRPIPQETSSAQPVAVEYKPEAHYDDGGMQATIWTPTTGEMSLEDSYERMQPPLEQETIALPQPGGDS